MATPGCVSNQEHVFCGVHDDIGCSPANNFHHWSMNLGHWLGLVHNLGSVIVDTVNESADVLDGQLWRRNWTCSLACFIKVNSNELGQILINEPVLFHHHVKQPSVRRIKVRKCNFTFVFLRGLFVNVKNRVIGLLSHHDQNEFFLLVFDESIGLHVEFEQVRHKDFVVPTAHAPWVPGSLVLVDWLVWLAKERQSWIWNS